MDKAKILRLCNEIEMIMCEVYNTGHMMQNCDYEAVDKTLKAIVAEITVPPKTNGDRIRAMTDEELAEFLDNNGIDCDMCSKNPAQCYGECIGECICGIVKFLKSEVSEDATERTD